MTKHTREKWTARIRDWRASGKSAEDFAADKDYEAASLRWAASQVGALTEAAVPKQAPAAATRRRPQTSAPKAQAPRFVPVRVRRSAVPPLGEMVVEVGGARIRVPRGADMTLLGEVVRALQGGGR